MKITVLLSAYNGEKYIAEQIDSVLAQNADVELIVRDDGSIDKTKDILRQYQKSNKLIWYEGENLGAAFSFLDLAKNVQGSDYYAFCDQDDVWESDKISTAILMLEKENNDRPLLYCSAPLPVDSDLKPIGRKNKKQRFKLTFGESLVQAIAPGCTFVFNEKARQQFIRYDSNNISMHDWLLHKLIAGLGKVIYDEKPHIKYRQHNANLIGYNRNFFAKRIKRFFKGNSKNIRLKEAQSIRNAYYDDLNSENRKILDMLADYRTSPKVKIKLFFSTKIHMSKIFNNIALKFLILFNKL